MAHRQLFAWVGKMISQFPLVSWPPKSDDEDSSAITVGIHKRYIQNQALTEEAKALLLEGQLKEGVDWVEYSENMGDEFLPVTLR